MMNKPRPVKGWDLKPTMPEAEPTDQESESKVIEILDLIKYIQEKYKPDTTITVGCISNIDVIMSYETTGLVLNYFIKKIHVCTKLNTRVNVGYTTFAYNKTPITILEYDEELYNLQLGQDDSELTEYTYDGISVTLGCEFPMFIFTNKLGEEHVIEYILMSKADSDQFQQNLNEAMFK